MSEKIDLPIFVYDGGDVLVFKSVEDLELMLEAEHIRDGGHEAYDSSGRKLVFDYRTILVKGMFFGKYNVEVPTVIPGEFTPNTRLKLANCLRIYLQNCDVREEYLAELDLVELANLVKMRKGRGP